LRNTLFHIVVCLLLRYRKIWGVNLTTQLHLLPRSRIFGVIPPLPQYVFMAWFSVKAQGQLYLLPYVYMCQRM